MINLETYLTEPSPPDPISYPIEHFNWRRVNCLDEFPLFALIGPAGTGKAQPLTATVLTKTGWLQLQDLSVGDKICTVDGSFTEVTGIFPQGKKTICEVTFSDGAKTRCCKEHLWYTETALDRPIRRKGSVKSTEEIANSIWGRPLKQTHYNHSIPMVGAVKFTEKSYLIHPYLMGVLLGDGCLRGGTVTITTPEAEIVNRIKIILPERISLVEHATSENRCASYALVDMFSDNVVPNQLTEQLRAYNLMGCGSWNKFIPSDYLIGSVEQRIDLLQGLLDTDGTVSNRSGAVTYTTASEFLADTVTDLINSLGGVATVTSRVPKYTYKGEKKLGRKSYTLHINLPNQIKPFSLSRKATRVIPKTKYFPIRYITKVEILPEEVDCVCISVADSSHLYVTNNYIVTHNTYLTREAIARDPGIGILAASTGIAAVNLGGAVTIHSLLKFYNDDSILYAFEKGKLQRNLEKIRTTSPMIIVDEAFMLNDRIMSTLYLAIDEVNRDGERMALVLLGDPAQLPPIPYDQEFQGRKVMVGGKVKKQKEIPWMFNSAEIKQTLRKPNHVIRLTEIKRQTDEVFIQGLNQLRVGNGFAGAKLLQQAGVNFISEQIPNFDGTTLIAVNEEVDRCNRTYLMNFDKQQAITEIPSYRWFGKQVENPLAKSPADWNTIPEKLELKIGAFVMLLANSYDASGEMIYANGDTGIIESIEAIPRRHIKYKSMSEEELQVALNAGEVSMSELNPQHTHMNPFADIITHDWKIVVRVIRRDKPDGYLVHVNPLTRQLESKMDIEDLHKLHPRAPKDSNGKPTKISNGNEEQVWLDGQIIYYPIRLAKFTTVHKCVAQGTHVWTDKGLQDIDSVKVGQYVNTGKQYSKILDVIYSEHDAYRIETVSGFELVCSGEHLLKLSTGDFIPAKELDPCKHTLHLDKTCQIPTLTTKEITPDLAWLLGVLVGDGSYTEQRDGQLHICSYHPWIQSESIRILAAHNVNAKLRADGKGVWACNKAFRQTLFDLGLTYDTALNKHIPLVVTSDKKLLCKFLQGLFDTDGHVGRSYVLFATSSETLGEQVHLCLEQLGMRAKRTGFYNQDNPYYQITVTAESIELFKDLINFTRPERKEKLAALKPNRIINYRGSIEKIKKVTELSTKLMMVDLTIESDHTYVSNGLVSHNCQGLSFDTVQVNLNHSFMKHPAMTYTALSRCRTAQGLYIVGSVIDLAQKTVADKSIQEWL